MGKSPKLLDQVTEPAPRAVHRRVGITVVVLIAAAMGWALMKHAATGDLADAKIRRGMDEIALALDGQPDHFDNAEELFLDAASVSVVDPYPMFLVRTGQRLEQQNGTGSQEEIASAVARRDWVEADRLVQRLGEESEAGAKLWRRFIADLRPRLEGGSDQHGSSLE